jgi:predicted lipid carrier protein YhbT
MAMAAVRGAKELVGFAGLALRPVPLFLLQPFLRHIVGHVARRRPGLFARLGPHKRTVFVIDVRELPFVLRLRPDPASPRLTAHRRSEKIAAGARIGGDFLALFRLIDGGIDGDALFFSRDLDITGDTEAIVCLRNALDDLEGSIVDDLMTVGGPLAPPFRLALSRLRQAEMAA